MAQQQQAAAAAFNVTLELDAIYKDMEWTDDTSPCAWAGVSCSYVLTAPAPEEGGDYDDGAADVDRSAGWNFIDTTADIALRITSIDFGSSNMYLQEMQSDAIPEEFSRLNELRSLSYLGMSGFTGVLPPWIGPGRTIATSITRS